MAPKKRSKSQEDEAAVVAKPAPAPRRSPRLAANSKADSAVVELPKSKKVKVSKKPKPSPKPSPKPEENGEVEEAENEGEEVDAVPETLGEEAKCRTVVIEHCKQCQSFKKRAIQVQTGLENGVPGITVLLNPDKPRRGCFEIRSEDGEKFVSLLDMKRPFTRMKDLDMEEVISDIVEKLKG